MSNPIINVRTDAGGITVHYLEAGHQNNPTLLLCHGYPETAVAFIPLMNLLRDKFHLVAPDLPGIGESGKIDSADKLTIASFLNEFLKTLKLNKPAVIGHDIGGMIVYSLLRHFPDSISHAVIMNTVIPGLSPWEEVKKNPHIWHFAFYSVPELPETLIDGHQQQLFDYFYDTLSFNKNAIPTEKRQQYVMAYQSPASLKTSLDWYRGFSKDEKDNSGLMPTTVPVLYIRGAKEPGNTIADYADGLKKSGVHHVTSKLIDNSGHFSPEEQPAAVANVINEFLR
ncbi:alpha/beta fold hydrolase [Chitinophaga sp. 22321]|uniref:Alpha/beta hydrolase n=1 Tax=Chitinophaga hostae TaxID=2831022 RepID=A0ABS5J8T0_9BACT|nr:alpha/beta hydrolase [Chitinophaga hostae]MBS0031623.1 alpha/beta hydrolase [Chitinophaga hostae]